MTGGALLAAIGVGGLVGYGLRDTEVGLPQTLDSSAPGYLPLPEPFAAKVLPPEPGYAYWGVYRDGAPYDPDPILGVEDQVGLRPAIVMWYQEWDGEPSFPVEEARWLAGRGIVPMLSWEPWRPPDEFGDLVVEQPEYSLSAIARGHFDPFIRRYAAEIRVYGGPLVLRPFHEMNGYWYPWGGTVNANSPEDFVAAWRHVHDLFEEVGATNVTWVWSVNHVSVPDTPDNEIEDYWPGARYVDWTGVSGFNWGVASQVSSWRTLEERIGDVYQVLLEYGKPIALTETGSVEAGGDKAAWIREAVRSLGRDFPIVNMFVWYDRQDSDVRDWRIDSSEAALDAFREAVSSRRVLSADTAYRSAFPHEQR